MLHYFGFHCGSHSAALKSNRKKGFIFSTSHPNLPQTESFSGPLLLGYFSAPVVLQESISANWCQEDSGLQWTVHVHVLKVKCSLNGAKQHLSFVIIILP